MAKDDILGGGWEGITKSQFTWLFSTEVCDPKLIQMLIVVKSSILSKTHTHTHRHTRSYSRPSEFTILLCVGWLEYLFSRVIRLLPSFWELNLICMILRYAAIFIYKDIMDCTRNSEFSWVILTPSFRKKTQQLPFYFWRNHFPLCV